MFDPECSVQNCPVTLFISVCCFAVGGASSMIAQMSVLNRSEFPMLITFGTFVSIFYYPFSSSLENTIS